MPRADRGGARAAAGAVGGVLRILPPRRLTVVEGSYSLHPRLVAQYDKAIFLTCSKERQMHRLKRREGDASRFKALWIPMEERYLECCNVRQTSDLTLDTSDFF